MRTKREFISIALKQGPKPKGIFLLMTLAVKAFVPISRMKNKFDFVVYNISSGSLKRKKKIFSIKHSTLWEFDLRYVEMSSYYFLFFIFSHPLKLLLRFYKYHIFYSTNLESQLSKHYFTNLEYDHTSLEILNYYNLNNTRRDIAICYLDNSSSSY